MLFHFGYQDSETNRIELQLDGAGYYTIEDITVFTVLEDEAYSERVVEKWAQALEIEQFSDEEVTGTITQETPGILTNIDDQHSV